MFKKKCLNIQLFCLNKYHIEFTQYFYIHKSMLQ